MPSDGIFSFLRYTDEILAVFSAIYICCNFDSLSKYEKRILLLCVLLVIFGVVCNVLSNILTNPFFISVDIVACIKVFLVFIWANHVIGEKAANWKYQIANIVKIPLFCYIIVAFAFGIISLFYNIGMTSKDVRFGIRSYFFLYDSPGNFSNLFYILLLLLTILIRNRKNNLILYSVLMCCLFTWCLTLRSRGILFSILYIIFYYVIVIKGKTIKLNFKFFLGALLVVLYFMFDTIMFYFFENDSMPRAVLLKYGIITMFDYFPIGAGFGTYGTDVAAKNYSKLYYKYNFEHYYGLNPNDTKYGSDNYWPAIMGQFGIIGIVIVVFILYYMYKELSVGYNNNNINRMFIIFVSITQLYASAATSVFFATNTVFLVFLLPLLKTNNKLEQTKNQGAFYTIKS